MSLLPPPTTALAGDGTKEPWLGLVPYLEADRDRFYGREQDALDLLRSIRREVLTVLFGRSGTGKSSLLRAGVFPKLREENFLPVWIRLDHSGTTRYFRQVREWIGKAVKELGLEEEILNPALRDEADDLWEYLHRAVFWDERSQPLTPVLVFDQFEELFTIGSNQEEIAVFLDELADLAEDHIPKRVRDLVESGEAKLPAAYAGRHYKLVISLREDFVSRLDGLSKSMPSVMHNRNSLKHMTGTQALEVVLKPGADLVDPEVADRIVGFLSAANKAESATAPGDAETSGGDDRPLVVEPAILSLVCRELNLRRINEGEDKITLKQVQSSSDQIIEDFYERSLEGLDSTDRVFIEDRLVTPSGFRTAVPMEEAEKAGLSKDEIELLIQGRLLRKEKRLGIPHIELTHDVLTKVVTRSRYLRHERDERQAEAKRLKDEEEAREQDRERREMEQKREREAKDQEREREAKEREQEIKSQRARRARWIATGVAAVFAVLTCVAYFSQSKAKKQSKIATEQGRAAGVARNDAFAQSLALNAVEVGKRDPELGLLLSIESGISVFDQNGSSSTAHEIEQSLRTSIRESLIRQRFAGHTSKVYSVDFANDGERLLTSSDAPDSTTRIWSVRTGMEIAKLVQPAILGSDEKSPTVSCARFSPDGRRIVTTNYRQTGNVYVWDAENLDGDGNDHPTVISKPQGVYAGHHRGVTAVAISPDGKWVASGGYDNEIQIWDLETRQKVERLPSLTGHTRRIRSIVFSSDGKRLVTTSDDGTAILWSLEDALRPAVIGGDSASLAIQDDIPIPAEATRTVPRLILNARPGRREDLQTADITPSGNHVATGGNDNFLRIWDARTGTQLVSEVHPASVWKVAFIDNMRLVSVCNDSTIRFWDLVPAVGDETEAKRSEPGAARVLRLVASQRGHNGRIRDVTVSPDKRCIVTAGDDGTVRRWTLPPGSEVTALGGYGRDFYWCADLGMIEGADGKRNRPVVYAGTAGGEIKAVDVLSELPLKAWGASPSATLRHKGEIRSLSVSPDGSRLVTAGSDQTAIVWDAGNGSPLFRWTGHQGTHGGSVYHARFSPDGKRIVSASNDGTAQVWNVETNAENASPELILIPGNARYSDADFQNHIQQLAIKLKDHADPASEFLW